jgi:phosphoribosylaminoimidazole carboxylase PurE protein
LPKARAARKLPQVGVLIGSRSDLPVMQACSNTLDELGIGHEVRILSAHRDPEGVRAYARGAPARGLQVLIAGAGGAAHLAGALAAWSTLPVIGVPLAATPLQGLDALLSTVQMPPGVPVATVAIGEPGARNAAFLAAEILGLRDASILARYQEARKRMRPKPEAP